MDYKHLQNCKLLPNRVELLKHLPQNGIVAELGVDHGDYSELILTHNQPSKLYLVDVWNSKRYHDDLRKLVEKKFSSQIKNKQVEMNINLSVDAAKTFPDNFFDWIYIDTDHGYKVTAAELQAYKSKIKPGGIIAGHDFVIGNWTGQVKYGVIDAVYEFCEKENWELVFLTAETGKEHPSFAVKKI